MTISVGDRVEVALPWRNNERVWATVADITENGWLHFEGDDNVSMMKAEKVLAVRHA